MTRIASKIALSVLGAAGVFLSSTPARAVILVEPIVTETNQLRLEVGEPRILGPDILPGQIIEYGVPDRANNLQNSTGNDIGSIVFDLKTLFFTSDPSFDNEPVEWGDVDGDGKIGFSSNPELKDIFASVVVEGSTITYSGGRIPDGSIFYNLFSTKPDLSPGGGIIPPAPPLPADQDGPIRVSAYYTAIPESTNVLGLLVFGALGLGFKLKRSL